MLMVECSALYIYIHLLFIFKDIQNNSFKVLCIGVIARRAFLAAVCDY